MAAPQRISEEPNQKNDRVDRASNDPVYQEQPKTQSGLKSAKILPFPQVRRTTTDRSDLLKTTPTRNVRVSNMPGSPKNQQRGSHQTVDEQFNESYSKQGIQPSSLAEPPAQKQQKYESAPQITRSAKVEYSRTPKKPTSSKLSKLTKLNPVFMAASAALGASSRLRATSINIGIWNWGLFTWLFFQLPMALISLGLIGIMVAIDKLKTIAEPATGEKGFWASVLDKSVKFVVDVTSAVTSLLNDVVAFLTGVDLSIFNPANFFLATYYIILAYAILLLLTIYLLYKIAFLNPLSGKGAGMKKGMFLLAIIGYSLPLLNFFPWFIFWTMAVWWKPK